MLQITISNNVLKCAARNKFQEVTNCHHQVDLFRAGELPKLCCLIIITLQWLHSLGCNYIQKMEWPQLSQTRIIAAIQPMLFS